ncbi:Suppressor of Sensor Kinase (SLN1) [Mortierella sp. NVP85]|nr:Suppressor of Sensor Kinase (SLN1) [Mortierella sp. NVP85]
MTWPLRTNMDEHRTSSPAPYGASQTIASHTGLGPGSTAPATPAPTATAERKKGVRFYFAEEEEPTRDNSVVNSDDEVENDDGAELDEETYDDSDMRDTTDTHTEVDGDEEVMPSLHDLDLHDSPVGGEADPIDEYYDNHGENADDVEVTVSSNKDQERLDRFMQPTSNSDEGVLELNRERIDWQSMLQSVLTGEVFSIENRRLEDNELQPVMKEQIWQGLRATIHARPVSDEKRFLELARTQVDGYLQEVMDFKVDPNSALSPIDQVLELLRKIDLVEGLYHQAKALREDKPLYQSPKFLYRMDALNAYATVMKKIGIQTKILRNWTGSETLAVSRSKSAGQDEVSFVDRLLKEDALEKTFEKSTLSALHNTMKQIKATMIENAVAFASMGLVVNVADLQRLIRFPTTLMQECLRLRLEYADRVTVPTLLNVDQMLEDFKTSLFLACRIKNEYEELESSDQEGWYMEPCVDPEYEKVLKSSLQFYFKLLSWKVEYWGQSKKHTDSVLDLEWDGLQELGQSIDGIGLDTAIQLCFLTSKSTMFLYKHLLEQMKENPDLPQTAGEVIRFYGKVLENVRSRANRLRRFARQVFLTLTDTFENSTEYLLDRKGAGGFGLLMNRLAETNHVMIYTNSIEIQGIYIIVENKVAENAHYLSHILRSCFEQPGNGYILVLTPRERFVWSGPIMHLEGFSGFDLDVKPGRVRLISEKGSLLDACKKRFNKFAEPCGLEIITESRANVTALNKELNKTKKAAYKLADTIVQSITVLRKVTVRVPNCQDLVQPFFRFATDYGLTSLSSMEGLPRSQFNLKLLRLAIDWVSFVCDDCDQTERQTFRWAMAALNFAMKMTKGNNILALSDSEFSWLRSKIAGCMTLLISHFDIHGARSQSESVRGEQDGRLKLKIKDHARLLEEIDNILKLATMDETVMTEEAARHHREQAEKLANLEKGRTERDQEKMVIGKVLDDQNPEDKSLAFLAALTDSKVIRWQMVRCIGSGSFGTVHLGTNSDTGELIAVKEIRFQNASMALVKSIEEEMSVMKMMNHPNIVRYDNIEVHRHRVYMFMEYCQGGSLGDLLQHGRIEDEKVIKIYTLQMLKGLAYLHDNNVVHRDVKPDNILLDHNSNIKFVDFGAAKILAKNQRTRTHRKSASGDDAGVGANSLNGTPMYMAPEVITNGDKGRKGAMDIWSLGCCVLEMTTGRRPWSHLDNEWAIMWSVATNHPPLPDPAQMSPKGIAFLKRCFTRSSRDRPSAVELLRDEWLRGVETDENSKEYYYEVPPVEVNSLEGNSIPQYTDENKGDTTYADSENGSYEDHGLANGHMEGVVQGLGDKVEILLDDGEGGRAFGTKDTLTVNGFAGGRGIDGAGGSKSPISCESVISDTASEVGSEVELMLSATREREENSRQVSKQTSPLLDFGNHIMASTPLRVWSSLMQSGVNDSSPPAEQAAAAAGNQEEAESIESLEQKGHNGFAREIGMDLNGSISPGPKDDLMQTSPVLSFDLATERTEDGHATAGAEATTTTTAVEEVRAAHPI